MFRNLILKRSIYRQTRVCREEKSDNPVLESTFKTKLDKAADAYSMTGATLGCAAGIYYGSRKENIAHLKNEPLPIFAVLFPIQLGLCGLVGMAAGYMFAWTWPVTLQVFYELHPDEEKKKINDN